GTLFSGHEVSNIGAPTHFVPTQSSSHVRVSWLRVAPCARSAMISQNVPVRLNHPVSHSSPVHLVRGVPAAGLRLHGDVLFGLLAGLSAALGFLVPPRSRLTGR